MSQEPLAATWGPGVVTASDVNLFALVGLMNSGKKNLENSLLQQEVEKDRSTRVQGVWQMLRLGISWLRSSKIHTFLLPSYVVPGDSLRASAVLLRSRSISSTFQLEIVCQLRLESLQPPWIFARSRAER